MHVGTLEDQICNKNIQDEAEHANFGALFEIVLISENYIVGQSSLFKFEDMKLVNPYI